MRILVVDDHLPTLDLMVLTLTSFGHTVSRASGVVEALAVVDRDDPELILSDLTFAATSTLPSASASASDDRRGADDRVPDGHALARAVRSRSRSGGGCIGLLAITGVVSPLEVQAAVDSGFDAVIAKPFDLESLIERIDAIARSKRTTPGSDLH